MATVGHIAAGIAVARAGRADADTTSLLAITVAAVAPDIDLLLGINHRGPTHSITMAMLTALAVFAAFRMMRHPQAQRVAWLAFGAVATHIILDLLTVRSGLSVLWPISNVQIVMPVTPLPSIPLDDRLASPIGLALVAGEILWSVAIVIGAGWIRAPRRR